MANWELKWKDCSGNFGPWRTKKGHFIYRLEDDLIIAHIGISRFEENNIEVFLEDKQNYRFKKKNIKYKNESEIENRILEAKTWAEKEMINILEKNLKALRGA